MGNKSYTFNLETSKIELDWSRADYEEAKKDPKQFSDLKYAFQWAGSIGKWVSRSTKNHWNALEFCKKYGFEDKGKVGEKLTFAEKMEHQAEKAEYRAERYEDLAEKHTKTAEELQKEFDHYHGDIAFFTQPATPNSRFGRFREKVYARYERGFKEMSTAKYFKGRASTATATAAQGKSQNKGYLAARIKERDAEIRQVERLLKQADEENKDEWFTRLSERMEELLDERGFFQAKLDELGGVTYSRANVAKGDWVKIRGRWELVVKANPTTVKTHCTITGFELAHPYAEILDHKTKAEYEAVTLYSGRDTLTE